MWPVTSQRTCVNAHLSPLCFCCVFAVLCINTHPTPSWLCSLPFWRHWFYGEQCGFGVFEGLSLALELHPVCATERGSSFLRVGIDCMCSPAVLRERLEGSDVPFWPSAHLWLLAGLSWVIHVECSLCGAGTRLPEVFSSALQSSLPLANFLFQLLPAFCPLKITVRLCFLFLCVWAHVNTYMYHTALAGRKFSVESVFTSYLFYMGSGDQTQAVRLVLLGDRATSLAPSCVIYGSTESSLFIKAFLE